MSDPLACLFIPHGGGPCFFMAPPPFLPPDTWDGMAAYLRGIGPAITPRPKAILVISGHWLAARPTVNIAQEHSLLFDYFGFPEHTYRLRYPAKGAPEVAARVQDLLAEAGIASDQETRRGLDHGVFVPFLLIYPEADIPIVQLSLRADLDAAAHLAIGRALAPLRHEGVLIVGSGMSYHNMRHIMNPRSGNEAAARFDHWLTETVTDVDTVARDAKLASWHTAPNARDAQPEPDHLMPLHVVAGAAGQDRGRLTYAEAVMGKAISGYQFG